MKRRLACLMALGLGLAGCQNPGWGISGSTPGQQMVQPNLFGSTPPARQPVVAVAPPVSNTVLARRVDEIGRKVLAANPELGLKPLFATYGTPTPEIFHQGTQVVYVSEGLVKKCASDGQLAALLSYELAEMVADREVLAHPRMRQVEPRPPITVTVGNGLGTPEANLMAEVELARYEKERQQARRKLVRPAPDKLARIYLEKAGFIAADLEAVRPVLRDARKNFALEKNFREAEKSPGWQATRQAAEKLLSEKEAARQIETSGEAANSIGSATQKSSPVPPSLNPTPPLVPVTAADPPGNTPAVPPPPPPPGHTGIPTVVPLGAGPQ